MLKLRFRVIMGILNNCFFSYANSRTAVVSLTCARTQRVKNMVFQFSLIAVLLLCTVVPSVGEDSQISPKQDPSGEIVFAKTPITKGSYARTETRDRFSPSDKVYARAFFREKLGELRDGESGFIDLTIDGRFIKRIIFTNSDIARWSGEAQIFIHNTGQDDFEGKPMAKLDSSEHEILVTVGRDFVVKNEIDGESKRRLTRILATGRYILDAGN